jgi:TPP-dependent pyruvate/acetoin dehydrogenase alpha subunit
MGIKKSKIKKIRAVYDKIDSLVKGGVLRGTIHLGRGQEALDCGVVDACPGGFFVGNHRSFGQYLQFRSGDDLIDKLKVYEGQHLYVPDKMITTGIQGAMTSFAVGTALAFQLKGIDRHVVCFVGDGTLGQGSFYEALGLASVFNPNITFIIVDNNYSMSKTKLDVCPEFLANAYALRYAEIYEANTYDRVYSIMQSWFTGKGAGIVYATVERLCGHSCNDTQRYRPKEELSDEYIKKHESRDK